MLENIFTHTPNFVSKKKHCTLLINLAAVLARASMCHLRAFATLE